jgi:predicted nucleotidyltransferase
MKMSLDEIKEKIVPILKSAGVTRSAIFGSYVRGEATEKSDIDILVDYPKGLSLFDVAELKYTLEDALEKPVDLVNYNHIKPLLKPYILSEQIPIL